MKKTTSHSKKHAVCILLTDKAKKKLKKLSKKRGVSQRFIIEELINDVQSR